MTDMREFTQGPLLIAVDSAADRRSTQPAAKALLELPIAIEVAFSMGATKSDPHVIVTTADRIPIVRQTYEWSQKTPHIVALVRAPSPETTRELLLAGVTGIVDTDTDPLIQAWGIAAAIAGCVLPSGHGTALTQADPDRPRRRKVRLALLMTPPARWMTLRDQQMSRLAPSKALSAHPAFGNDETRSPGPRRRIASRPAKKGVTMSSRSRQRWFGGLMTAAGLGLAVAGASVGFAQSSSEPAEHQAQTSEPGMVEQLSPAQESDLRGIVFDSLPLPKGTEIIRVEPSFDENGVLTAGVAVVKFAPYTGTLVWPSDQLYRTTTSEEADGVAVPVEDVWLTDVYEYQVENLQRALVAVDLSGGRVQWAAPDPGAEVEELIEAGQDELAIAADPGRYVSSRLVSTITQDGRTEVTPATEGLVQVRAEPGQ